MNSLASSASSGLTSDDLVGQVAEQLLGPAAAPARCGPTRSAAGRTARSSPCPRRSARGRTRRRPSRPCRASSFSVSAVTPGWTVLRSTSSWPSRRCSTHSSIACGTAREVRVEVLVDRRADDDDDVLGRARRWPGRWWRPAGPRRPRSASGSVGAVLGERQRAGVDHVHRGGVDVVQASRRDRATANAMPSGRPTRPHPPMITTSRANGPSAASTVTASPSLCPRDVS